MSREVRIMTVNDQRSTIHTTTNYTAYNNLISTYFTDGTHSEVAVSARQHLEVAQIAPHLDEQYRFLGLIALVCAQFGFPSISGMLTRHERKWRKSPFDQKHSLALASYLGHLNMQATPFKSIIDCDISRDFPQYDLRGAALGIFLPPVKGNVPMMRDLRHIEVEKLSRRKRSSRPVCETDLELNEGLAQLNFTGEMAEVINDEEFFDTVFPQLSHVFCGLVDPEKVFTSYR